MSANLTLVVRPSTASGCHPSDGALAEASRSSEPEEWVIGHLVDCDLCQGRLNRLLNMAEGRLTDDAAG